ncbi:FadR family transcriptional regulator [Leucobacter zeae]|nr:FadR family transcriptional regulator [Leucobacter zeae]
MQQIQRRSLVDTAVEQMRLQVTGGAWAVGARIPSESELTTMLGVSRPSVREAVRSLVQLGLLETRQGDGTYVVADDATQVALRRAIGAADTREVIRVRRALDVLAGREAAENRSAADLQELADLLALRREAIAAVDIEAFTEADVEFHLAVARASGNQLLSSLYASFDTSLRESITDASQLAKGADPDRADMHEALFRAISEGDVELAMSASLGVLDQQERLLDESS